MQHNRFLPYPMDIWYLPSGSHLCHSTIVDGELMPSWRPFGTSGDENGRKTYWVSIGLGVLVLATRFFTVEEIIATSEGLDEAMETWSDYVRTRSES